MRTVRDPDELEGAFQTAAAEAQAAFGEPGLYLEKAIVPARHVEIQVLADGQGGVLTLGERECSIQRRHQKLIEESPSPALDEATRAQMEDAAERAARAVEYENAGTFEFLLGPDRSFYFIELNARLQVEHPVSELVTGIDLVREQLRVAAGETPVDDRPRGAERPRDRDPHQRRGSRPRVHARARGGSSASAPPLGPGVRVDTHIEDGAVIPPNYDSLLAKVIVRDTDRPSAIDRALRALAELEVVGVPTTAAAARDVLRTEEFATGRYSTSFLEEAGRRLPALAG